VAASERTGVCATPARSLSIVILFGYQPSFRQLGSTNGFLALDLLRLLVVDVGE